MSEPTPTVESLQAELVAMQAQMAEFLAQSGIKPGPHDPKLVPQPELDRRYAEVRKRNLTPLKDGGQWLSEEDFRGVKKAAQLETRVEAVEQLMQLILAQAQAAAAKPEPEPEPEPKPESDVVEVVKAQAAAAKQPKASK